MNTMIPTQWLSNVDLKTSKSIVGSLIIRRKKCLRPDVDFNDDTELCFSHYEGYYYKNVDAITNYRINIAISEWNDRKHNKTIAQLVMESVLAGQGRVIGNLVARYF